MGDVYIGTEKREQLRAFMESVGVREEDLVEKFVLGSGRGGQKVNKTASCVYLRHAPTGMEAKCQPTRSRELNRYYARKTLCERLDETIRGENSRRQQEAERIRRQKRRRSRRQRERILEEKHQRSERKQTRGRVGMREME